MSKWRRVREKIYYCKIKNIIMDAKKLFLYDLNVSLLLCLPFLWLAICLPVSDVVWLRIVCLFHVLFAVIVFGVSKTAYEKACSVSADEENPWENLLDTALVIAELCRHQRPQSPKVEQHVLKLQETVGDTRKELEQKKALSSEAKKAALLEAVKVLCRRKNIVELLELFLVSIVVWRGVENVSIILWHNFSWYDLFGIFLILSGVKNVVVYSCLMYGKPKKHLKYLFHFSKDGKCAYGNLREE